MADQSIPDLTADATPTIDDLLYTINDPGDTPVDRKVTLQNLLKLAPHWVDRGDPSAYDFTAGDFTQDNNWYDLDLSSIVPAGAVAVLLRVGMQDATTDTQVSFRKNGNSNVYNAGVFKTVEANIDISGELMVFCDTNRVIEYRVSQSLTALNVLVMGWYIDTVN